MRLFWKFLPLSLPLLMLVLVLSSCGKKSGITGNIFNEPKVIKKAVLGQRATGQSDEVDVEKFRQNCAQVRGRLELENGGLCVLLVKSQRLDPATIGPQTILTDFKAGDYVISSVSAGTIDSQMADVQLAAEHFINLGERKLGERDGELAFNLVGTVSGIATVSVYSCRNPNMERVPCNMDIFKHP